MLIKGILRAWDGVNHLANVEPGGTLPSILTGIPVSRGIPAAEMVVGRYVALAAFDPANPSNAVVVAVYT